MVTSLRSQQRPYIHVCIAILNNIFWGSLISSKYKLSLRAYDLLQLTIKMRNMIYQKLVTQEYGKLSSETRDPIGRQLPKARSLIFYTKDPGGYTLLDGNVPQPKNWLKKLVSRGRCLRFIHIPTYKSST